MSITTRLIALRKSSSKCNRFIKRRLLIVLIRNAPWSRLFHASSTEFHLVMGLPKLSVRGNSVGQVLQEHRQPWNKQGTIWTPKETTHNPPE
jgi:hypothetical protein